MKIYFYGGEALEPAALAEVFGAFKEHLSSYSEPKLFAGSPVIYVPIKDVDGDTVSLIDNDNPDVEISWEVRNVRRQTDKGNADLVYSNDETHVYIYQHREVRSKSRF